MSRGLGGRDDLELEMRGQDKPDVWAKLREIENRAFEKSGRIAALKKQAAEEDASQAKSEVKAKIVDRLASKSKSKVTASAKAGAKTKKKSD